MLKTLGTNYLSKRVVFTLDLMLSLLSSVSLILVLSWLDPWAPFPGHTFSLVYAASSLVGSVVLLLLTKCYRIIIRHLNVRDLAPFVLASAGKAVVVTSVLLSCGWRLGDFLLLTLLDFFVTFFLMLVVRVGMILVYEVYANKVRERSEQQRILVYDTSDKSLASLVRLRHSGHYRIVGFLLRGKET